MGVVTILMLVLGAYTTIGVVFAALFVIWGVGKIDEASRGASVGVRLLLVPGSVAMWPMLGRRWLAAPKRKEAGS